MREVALGVAILAAMLLALLRPVRTVRPSLTSP